IANTVSVTGTSASAAIVAGSAAQLIATDPSATPGAIVGRLARNADPDGGVGNGRVNLNRALNDTSTDPVVPAGAPGGGPVVGPYLIAKEKSVLQGWRKSSNVWSNINSAQVYSEGSTIPVQVDITALTAGTTYTVALRYDFVN